MSTLNLLTSYRAIFCYLLLAIIVVCWHMIMLWYALDAQDLNRSILEVRSILSNFAAGVFIISGWHLKERNDQTDFSLLFFGLAMLAWGIPFPFQEGEMNWKILHTLFYSTLNNMFFFMAFGYIEYGGTDNYQMRIFKYLGIKDRSSYLKRIAQCTIIIFVLHIIGWGASQLNTYYILVPFSIDIVISLTVLVWLWRIFFLSFEKRMDLLSQLSMKVFTGAVIIIAVSAQILSYIEFYFKSIGIKTPNLTPIVLYFNSFYHLNLIFLIGSLAFSWAMERVVRLQEKIKEEEREYFNQERDLLEKTAREAEFKHQDLLHVVRNSLFYLEHDFKGMAKSYQMHQKQDLFELARDSALRISIIQKLLTEMHAHEIKQGLPFQDCLRDVLDDISKILLWEKFEINIMAPPKSVWIRGTAAQKIAKVIVELCINAFKYGRKSATVTVTQKSYEETVVIIQILDEGIVPFSPKDGFINWGSFGLNAVNEYLKSMEAPPVVFRENPNGNGTIAEIHIPLTNKIKLT